MISALIAWILDASHCASWTSATGRPACADIRLDARGCTTVGWHRVWRQQILVCVRECGAEGPTS